VEFGRRHNGDDARQGERGAPVDSVDPGVGVRTPEEGDGTEIRQIEVGKVTARAG
jgi:hypothetical protein